jgi:hypothetical protein
MDSIPFFTQPINTIHPITPSPQEKTFKKKLIEQFLQQKNEIIIFFMKIV